MAGVDPAALSHLAQLFPRNGGTKPLPTGGLRAVWKPEVAMKILALAVWIGMAGASLAADIKDPAKSGPAYDAATVVDVTGVIIEVRELPKGNALEGVNLTIKVKNDTFNVYVAPVEFLKMLDAKFAKNDEVQVAGSKVKFDGAELILAREVRLGKVSLMVRDKDGSPFWKYFSKVPTGL